MPKWVKTVKFFNYKTDCQLAKQVIVDEGYIHQSYRQLDTSMI